MAGNNIGFGVQAKGVAKASSDLDKLKDKFEKLQKQGAKGVGVGIAAGATSFALGAASQAVGQLTDVVGESIKAALEDEESQNRLRASLEANVPAWNGNTDAIEKNILAKQRLGFSDETLRDSLTVLVGATHDVTKAQEIMNTAMDLARFKHIDLKTASESLIKVEGGAYRSLKGLGIVLKDGATQTEALAAVQKVAAGQAEAYARTNQGKLEASQVKVNEALERFGGTIMPTAIDALTNGATAAVAFADTLDLLQNGVAKTTDGQAQQAQSLIDVQKAIAVLFPAFGMLADAEQDHLDAVTAALDANGRMGISAGKMADDVVGAADDVVTAAKDWRDKYQDIAGAIIRSSHRVTDALVADAARVRGEAFDETEIRASLHDQRLALLDLQRQKRDAKTAEEARQAADDIVQALDDEGASLEDLGAQGNLTQTDVDRFTKDAHRSYQGLSKKAIANIEALIKKYQTLVDQPNVHKTFTVDYRVDKGSVNDTHGKGHGQLEFDTGGTVPGPQGKAYEATVHGGETVRTPAQERALHEGGGDTYNYNLTVQGRWDVDKNSVGAAVQRLRSISHRRAA